MLCLPGNQAGASSLTTTHQVISPPKGLPKKKGIFLLQPGFSDLLSPTAALSRSFPLINSQDPTSKKAHSLTKFNSLEDACLEPCHSWLHSCSWWSRARPPCIKLMGKSTSREWESDPEQMGKNNSGSRRSLITDFQEATPCLEWTQGRGIELLWGLSSCSHRPV